MKLLAALLLVVIAMLKSVEGQVAVDSAPKNSTS